MDLLHRTTQLPLATGCSAQLSNSLASQPQCRHLANFEVYRIERSEWWFISVDTGSNFPYMAVGVGSVDVGIHHLNLSDSLDILTDSEKCSVSTKGLNSNGKNKGGRGAGGGEIYVSTKSQTLR